MDRERVSLSLKATQEDPWQHFARTHQLGQVTGNDRHLGQQPKGDPAEPRQKLAAGLGQIQPRSDAQPAAK